MATALDIVTDALRKLEVCAVGDAPEAEDAELGVISLNRMMHGWKAQGVDTEHTDLALSDTFPLNPEFEQATVMLLATYIATDYRKPPPDPMETSSLWRALQGAYWVAPEVEVDEILQCMPSQRRYGYGGTKNV